jgi:uncharacterized protein DUF3347
MRTLKYIFIIAFLFIISCTKKDQEDINKKIDTASHKLNRDVDTLVNKLSPNDSLYKNVNITKVDLSQLPGKEFRKQLNEIFDKYSDIKNALSSDDSAGAVKETSGFIQAIRNAQAMESAELTGTKWKLWISTVEKIISELSLSKTLKQQRVKFSDLSASMFDMIKTFGVYDKTIYKIECVKINRYWLTDSRETDNPYYGKDRSNEKSQPCFRIIETLKFD